MYTVSEKKESVIRARETSSSLLFGWFNNNFMKANSDKSHLIMSCAEETTAMIDSFLPIDYRKAEVLLGITIDHELKFDNHVNRLCKKASLKLNALARIAPFMNVSKKQIIMKSFIESQFEYCPLI